MTHHSVDDISIAGTVNALLTVYVKVQDSQASQYKLDFFHSLGGQTHAFCSCNTFPLITSGRIQKDKRLCMQAGCTGKERLICSNNFCNTCICRQCFDGLSMTKATTLSPMSGANESSKRILVPDALDIFPSVSHPTQQNFEEPTNLTLHSFQHKANMAKTILPPRHFLIATAGSSLMRKMRMILVYTTF